MGFGTRLTDRQTLVIVELLSRLKIWKEGESKIVVDLLYTFPKSYYSNKERNLEFNPVKPPLSKFFPITKWQMVFPSRGLSRKSCTLPETVDDSDRDAHIVSGHPWWYGALVVGQPQTCSSYQHHNYKTFLQISSASVSKYLRIHQDPKWVSSK